MTHSVEKQDVPKDYDLIRYDFSNELTVFVGHIQLQLCKKLGTSSFDEDNPPPAQILYAAIQAADTKGLKTFDERYINDPSLSTSIMYRELALQFKKDYPEIVRELNACIKTLRKKNRPLVDVEKAYRILWQRTRDMDGMSLPPSRQDLERYNNAGLGSVRALLNKPSP